MKELKLTITSDGAELGSILARVPGPLGRMRGLIGRPPPGAGAGLLLKGGRIHTFGMTYPIDVVYLSRRREVLAVHEHPPRRVGPRVRGARWVLEMAHGQAIANGIVQGVVLGWEG